MGSVQVGKRGGGGSRGLGGLVFSQWAIWGKSSALTCSNLFLNILTEGAVTTEAGSLFKNYATINEMAFPVHRRRLAHRSTR